MIEYFEENDQECALVFLDFQKAFDTVGHDFLFKTLSKFNFGESFQRWVHIMYNNAESCVTNNGWTSKPFKVQKMYKTGMSLERTTVSFNSWDPNNKNKKNAEGMLKLEVNGQNRVIQISQLVDDTTLFFANEDAIINRLKIGEEFGNVSGLRLKKDKTDGLCLGRGINRNDGLAGINWDKQTVKALG